MTCVAGCRKRLALISLTGYGVIQCLSHPCLHQAMTIQQALKLVSFTVEMPLFRVFYQFQDFFYVQISAVLLIFSLLSDILSKSVTFSDLFFFFSFLNF